MRVRALVFDEKTYSLRTAEIRMGESTSTGKIIFYPKDKAALLQGRQAWIRERTWPLPPVRYILLRDGDARPILLEDKADTAPYDAGMFNAAIKSSIATRFLRGEQNFTWMFILLLLLANVVLGIGLAFGR